MAKRVRSHDGHRETDDILGAKGEISQSGRQGGRLARDSGTEEQLKRAFERPAAAPRVKSTDEEEGDLDMAELKDGADNKTSKKLAQDEPLEADDSGQKVDRPGFDLGGASDDTHAGTGLGLGNDAFDTPGDRRLPGRRLDNKLTKPRWGGPGRYGTAASDEEPSASETPPTPQTKREG